MSAKFLRFKSEKKNEEIRAPDSTNIEHKETNKETLFLVIDKRFFKILAPCLINLFIFSLDKLTSILNINYINKLTYKKVRVLVW